MIKTSIVSALFFLVLPVLNGLSNIVLAQDVDYRLPSTVTPVFQKIDLKVDPDNTEFSGETRITVTVNKPTDRIGFYQRQLTIRSAHLIDGEQRLALSIEPTDFDIHYGVADKLIEPRQYVLHIVFEGSVNKTSDGLYLSRFEDRNYLFTQFEDMFARMAFPSFDEPDFKIPYQLTVSAPGKHTVLSNTPVKKRTIEQDWQTVEFEQTKPMPTYLVALAVGEMDSAEIPGLSVPGRIYTPKGQAHRTKFVAKHTAEILAALEDYFGQSYPYQKLDFVAVPNFTHGAMENAGLITYRSSLLLLDDEPRLVDRSRPLAVVAHELAHQWYGNLVTMAWWNDLWLNEAFASWMGGKIMRDLYPEHDYGSRLVQEYAFRADARPTTRPVQKEVRVQSDVMDGLGLNYSKGEAILQLMESLVGEKKFQQAVQSYMRKHAWGNAKADDLWAVLAKSADFDVPAMMRTYLEQPSYPLVSFTQDGGISQDRFAFSGAEVTPQQWIVPLNIRYKKNGKIKRINTFLSEASAELKELADAEWIFPNQNARGYMRWQIPAAQQVALLNDIDQLNNREKKNLLYNSMALLKADKLPFDEYMEVLSVLAEQDEMMVVRAVVGSLNELTYLVDETNEVEFARFIQSKFDPWFIRLGVEAEPTDSNDRIRLRQDVFELLGLYSQNRDVSTASMALTKSYLSDFDSVSKSMAMRAMKNVAKKGSTDWFEKYKAAYLKTSDSTIRGAIAGAMEFPQDNNVISLLKFSLSDAVTPADTIEVLATASEAQENQKVFYTWLDKNFDAVTTKMSDYHVVRLPEYVSATCSNDNMALAEAVYKGRMDRHEGMSRSYQVAVATTQQCIDLKARNQKPLTEYLQKFSDA